MISSARNNESGYSVVEVMVAIIILMVAILPMFKMFDVGLQTATRSSDYDRARALAEKQTEIAQSVGFDSLATTFPKCNGAAVPVSAPEATGCGDGAYPGLRFSVEKSYVEPIGTSEITLSETDTAVNLVKIVIKVYEEGDDPNAYIFRIVGVIANDG